jgi:hypothetical protein
MRRIALGLCIFWLLGVAGALANDFCNGFVRGYATGYKRASGSSIDPIPPICPIPPIKSMSDPQSDYEHGYLIGLEQGMQEGRR